MIDPTPIWVDDPEDEQKPGRQITLTEADLNREGHTVRIDGKWYAVLVVHDREACEDFHEQPCKYDPTADTEYLPMLAETPPGAWPACVPPSILEALGLAFFTDFGGEAWDENSPPNIERIWNVIPVSLMLMDHPPELDLMPRKVKHNKKTMYVFPCWVCKGQRYFPAMKLVGTERVYDEDRKQSACFECHGNAWVPGKKGVPYAR